VSGRAGLDDLTAAGATAADLDALPRIVAWPELPPEALYGLAGDIVGTLAPYSEADPVTLLVSLQVGFGNVVGPQPHARVGLERHPPRLFGVIVGQTARARKGTGTAAIRGLLTRAAPDWAACVKGGASSGEGLIFHVRDPRSEDQPIKERGRVVGYQTVQVDDGVRDKRLCIIETEFGSVLRRMKADTNTLSAVLRQAWDTGDLATLTKHSPLRATGAHTSLVGHITEEELRAELASLEAVNGFGNRMLFHLVKRAQLLPDGPTPPEAALATLVTALRGAVAFASDIGEIPRDPAATELWRTVYPALAEESAPGLAGAVTSRAEAQVVRLSLVYALLSRSPVVQLPHLTAALACWQHAERSARRIFGALLGSPLADRILRRLREHGPHSLTQLHQGLGGHADADAVQRALDLLKTRHLARSRPEPGKGRTAFIWEALA
jgi:hypothetical protein